MADLHAEIHLGAADVAATAARGLSVSPEAYDALNANADAFARMLLRPKDQLRLFELHPTDHRILASYVGEARGVEVYDKDGFDGLKGQVPPSTKRGLVLMDPSYEGNGDYGRVVVSLREMWICLGLPIVCKESLAGLARNFTRQCSQQK